MRASVIAGKSLRSPVPTSLDIAMEALRNTYLADRCQIENHMSSIIKDLKEEKRQLQKTVSQQLVTMTEQRVELDNGKERLLRHAETAKSNQKYVTGLQKDHERSRKAVVICQEQAKAVLRAKISELLEDRESLEDALNRLLVSISKSQRGMQSTMEELNVRCEAAEGKERELQKRLETQTSLYEEEKDQRIELEKRILPIVQDLQGQLEESSATLFKTLGSLGTDLQSRASDPNDLRAMKQCLSILQKMEASPPVTAQDIQKAEGMLRYLHER